MKTVVPSRPLMMFQCHVPITSLHSLLTPLSTLDPSSHNTSNSTGDIMMDRMDDCPKGTSDREDHCHAYSEMSCVVSWCLGVVVVSDGQASISIYSLERTEKLHSFTAYLEPDVAQSGSLSCSPHCFPENLIPRGVAWGDKSAVNKDYGTGNRKCPSILHANRTVSTGASFVIQQVFLCQSGKVVVSMTYRDHNSSSTSNPTSHSGTPSSMPTGQPSGQPSDATGTLTTHVIATYTLSGILCNALYYGTTRSMLEDYGRLQSQPSYVNCYANLDIVVLGLNDGTVMLCSSNLAVYYLHRPHTQCQLSNDKDGSSEVEPVGYVHVQAPHEEVPDVGLGKGGAVCHVGLGPDPAAPLLLTTTTMDGCRFVDPMPHYINGIKRRGDCPLDPYTNTIIDRKDMTRKGSFTYDKVCYQTNM